MCRFLPDRAFYVYMDVSQPGWMPSICERALQKKKPMVYRATTSDDSGGGQHVRLSYAASLEDLRRAVASGAVCAFAEIGQQAGAASPAGPHHWSKQSIHLVPGGYKSLTICSDHLAGHTPQPGRAVEHSAKDQVHHRGRPLHRPVFTVTSFSTLASALDRCQVVLVINAHSTKKSLLKVSGRWVNTPCWLRPVLAFKTHQTAHQHRHFRRLRFNNCLVDQHVSGVGAAPGHVVAESIDLGLQHGERFDIGLLLRRGIGAARRERHRHLVTRLLRRRLDGGTTNQHTIRSANDTFLRRRLARR